MKVKTINETEISIIMSKAEAIILRDDLSFTISCILEDTDSESEIMTKLLEVLKQ